MTIQEILRSKGPNVITVAPDVAVQEAMATLARHNIGALVVYDGKIRGIITERDLLRAGADDVGRLAGARVRELMTTDVVTATPRADIRGVMDVMTERRIRHLPIVEDGALHGIISIGDVVNALRSSVEAENRYLQAYITGAPL